MAAILCARIVHNGEGTSAGKGLVARRLVTDPAWQTLLKILCYNVCNKGLMELPVLTTR